MSNDEGIERTPEDHARFSENMAAIRKSQMARIADALSQLDAHTIYDRRALNDLAAAGVDVNRLSSQTPRQVANAIKARGLGGSIDPNAPDQLYTGHVVSDEVVRQLGLLPAGRAFYGRGSAHRANIQQLRDLSK